MAFYTVNNHNIDVPADMKVRLGGMFDAITYKGVEINTTEVDGEERTQYTGPFYVACFCDGYDKELSTLDEVRDFINNTYDVTPEDC